MYIPRISDSLVANNLWLLSVALVFVLIVVWVGIFGVSVGLRWLLSAVRIKPLAHIATGFVRLAKTLATVSSLIIILSAIGLLGYGIWKEVDFQVWADQLTEYVGRASLWVLLYKTLAIAGLAIASFYLHRLGKSVLPMLQERFKHSKVLEGQEDLVAKLFSELPQCLTLLILFVASHPLTDAIGLPASIRWFISTAIFIAFVAYCSRLVVEVGWLALAAIDHFISAILHDTSYQPYYAKAQQLMPLARRSIEAITYLAAATLIVRRFESLEPFAPYGTMIIQLIGIFFVTKMAVELVDVLIRNLMLRNPSASEESRQRRLTLTVLLQGLTKYLLYFAMCLAMLIVVGIDPTPILAGAGILGLAVGLGSQKIVQDVVSGFFMLFEDQMLIGDYVKIGDTEGEVEHLFLRVTRIRDRYGRVHTLRNGDIQNVINYSRGWTLAVVEMSVAYEAELPKVFKVMNDVAEALPSKMPGVVLEPAEVKGIERMADSCLLIRVETKTKPGCHYEAKRVLNQMLVEAFRNNQLEIPYPKGIEFDSIPG